MRRLWLLTLMLVLLLVAALPVMAQEATPDIAELVERAEDAAARAEAASAAAEGVAERADKAVDLGFNLVGLFEVFGGLISIVAVFGGAAGVTLAVRRFNSLQKQMEDTRRNFETEMHGRQAELDGLRDELRHRAEQLDQEAQRSTLALSLLTLADRQYKAQDFAGAAATYLRALELDPDNLISHYRLGYVNTQMGELVEAEQSLLRALAIEENFAPATATLGYVYRRIGERMEPGLDRDQMINRGEAKLLEALKLSPKLIDEDDESWWGSLGGLYRRRGQVKEAIYAYEQAAEVTPHSSYPFSNLALLYMQTGNRELMLKTYKRVEQLAYGEVQAAVDNYWGYADLLTARLALGKFTEAEPVLDMVFDIAPKDSPYVFQSLTDTLTRLASVLDAAHATRVREVAEQIRARMPAENGA